MMLSAAFVALAAALGPTAAWAGKPLTYEDFTKDSLASAMMLGLVDNNTAFVLDKVEGNPTKLPSGKPVWGSLIDLTDGSARAVDVNTNTFCAAGATMPNGTWIVVGGNQAVQWGGAALAGNANPYQDKDGRKSIRFLDIQGVSDKQLNWDDDGHIEINSPRWYPTVETLASGEAVIVGGATSGGYINRNTPNTDPTFATSSGGGSITNLAMGGANPTYEYFPNRTNITAEGSFAGMQMSKFMTTTSGLNMYPHMFLLPSGKIFMNANASNIIWDHNQNVETPLPDTPGGVVRVYPASGAVAMKPLTPANKYTPDILFCGGMVLDNDDQWGNYTAPNVNMYETPASKNCASIIPENADGSEMPNAQFVQDDELPQGRSMGEFIHLPTGQMLIVNGAENGTAGYGNTTWNTVQINGKTVNLEGFSAGPTTTPVLYNPDAPKGQRFTSANFGSSPYARLYHSTAILVPDGSVLVGGSNPHQDVSLDMPLSSSPAGFNTTYVLERWYPDYFFAPRPEPEGLPDTIGYGGDSFNVTVPASYFNKSSNALAASTKFMVIRPGFATHAMNMGQRSLQLDNTYAVQDDGSVLYTVNPLPTNPNLVTPGPALLFVTIGGVPSQGKFISVGGDMAKIGNVPLTPSIGSALSTLTAPTNNTKFDEPATTVYTGTGAKTQQAAAQSGSKGKDQSSAAAIGLHASWAAAIGVPLLAASMF